MWLKPCLTFCLALLVGLSAPLAQTGLDRTVVLISVDGLASYYLDDPMADMPNLRRMAREGAVSQRMEVAFPSVTWTVHTSLMTGVHPRRHGIIANSAFDRKKLEIVRFIGDARFTKEESVRAPTIFDRAYEAGLRTAAVNWPATRGAPTLHWQTPDVNSRELLLGDSTPELNQELGPPLGNPVETLSSWRWGLENSPLRDRTYVQLAAYLLTQKRPNLLLLHLVSPDSFQHRHGPRSPEAYWSVAYIDRCLGELFDTVEEAGLADRTIFFVTADHGFESIAHTLFPNVLLRREGLAAFETSNPQPGSRAYVVSHGGTASVYVLEDRERGQWVSRLKALFSGLEGVERVIGASEFRGLGLPTPEENPLQGDLILVAKEHYAFSGSAVEDEVVRSDVRSGSHGHLPGHPRMAAAFIAWGKGIRRGVKIDVAHSVDVAPTIAKLLGLTMEDVDGRVLQEILEEPD